MTSVVRWLLFAVKLVSVLQVLSIWSIYSDGKDLKWNKDALKEKVVRTQTFGVLFITGDETLALKAWQLPGFIQFLFCFVFFKSKFYFLLFLVPSPSMANVLLFINLLYVFHDAFLLGNLQMMIKKNMYFVPSTILVSSYMSPPPLKEGTGGIPPQNGAQRG